MPFGFPNTPLETPPACAGKTYGKPFTKDVENYILELLKLDYTQGLTLLGGDPFEEENQRVLAPFVHHVKETYSQKDIWYYTGYTFDVDLVKGGRKYTEVTDCMISCLDYIVGGRFEESLKDITLLFRGSSNQRIIPLS